MYWEFIYLLNIKPRFRVSVGCQKVGMPGLGSRLNAYKMVQMVVSIKPLPLASPSRRLDSNQKEGREERMLRRSETEQAWFELQSQ